MTKVVEVLASVSATAFLLAVGILVFPSEAAAQGCSECVSGPYDTNCVLGGGGECVSYEPGSSCYDADTCEGGAPPLQPAMITDDGAFLAAASVSNIGDSTTAASADPNQHGRVQRRMRCNGAIVARSYSVAAAREIRRQSSVIIL